MGHDGAGIQPRNLAGGIRNAGRGGFKPEPPRNSVGPTPMQTVFHYGALQLAANTAISAKYQTSMSRTAVSAAKLGQKAPGEKAKHVVS